MCFECNAKCSQYLRCNLQERIRMTSFLYGQRLFRTEIDSKLELPCSYVKANSPGAIKMKILLAKCVHFVHVSGVRTPCKWWKLLLHFRDHKKVLPRK